MNWIFSAKFFLAVKIGLKRSESREKTKAELEEKMKAGAPGGSEDDDWCGTRPEKLPLDKVLNGIESSENAKYCTFYYNIACILKRKKNVFLL